MYKLFMYPKNKFVKYGYLEVRAYLNCWKCNSDIKNTVLVCDNCTTVQKPRNTNNYFEVLNIKENFDIDLKKLTNKYRVMQSILHPDKFVNKSADEKMISAEYSSLVNNAYKTLQTPLKRAIHMLRLKDILIGEDDKASDPQFLMEILELNEEIDECNTDKELLKLNERNRETLDRLYKSVSKYLKDKDYTNAKLDVIKMKYYNSINTRINNLLRESGCIE